MLSNILQQIKNLDKSNLVNVYITKLLYTQYCHNVNFADFSLINGSEQDIYDVKNTFKYIKLFNKDITRHIIQVLIIDDYKLAKFILNNNYVKYIIFMSSQNIEFQNFLYSNNASTENYKVFINKQTSDQKFYSQSFHPTNNIQLLPENKNVNIIIPIFNNLIFTLKCLKLLVRYASTYYKVNLILIDNGSQENNIIKLQKFCKKNSSENFNIVLLKQNKNLGYTLSMNIGIKYALQKYPSSYTLLMHNDVQVPPHYLDNLLKYIKDNTVATVPVTSDLVVDQGFNNIREKKLIPNFPDSFFRLKIADITELLENLYKDYAFEINPSIFRTKMFCIALNTLIFQKIGIFDPIFTDGYSADDDFIARLYLNGYIVKLVPSVPVKHDTGTTYRIWNNRAQDLIKLKVARYLQYQLTNCLNINKNKKTVIYTCNFDCNENKNINKITYYNTQQFDYIYFTSNMNINVPQPWLKIDIHKAFRLSNIQEYSPEIFKTWIKIHPHMFFRNYQYSIYIDNDYNLIKQTEILLNLLKENQFIFAPKNNNYSSIKKYCQYAKLNNLDTLENIDNFYKFICNQKQKIQNTIGILDTSLLIREHNNLNCIKFMHNWWQYICKFSKIDMLSFTYLVLKNNIDLNIIDLENIQAKYIQKFNK